MNAATTSGCSTELNWVNRNVALWIPEIEKNCATMQQTVRTQRLTEGNHTPIAAVVDGRVKYLGNDLNAAATTLYEKSGRPRGGRLKVEGGGNLRFWPVGLVPPWTETLDAQHVATIRQPARNANFGPGRKKVTNIVAPPRDEKTGFSGSLPAARSRLQQHVPMQQ